MPKTCQFSADGIYTLLWVSSDAHVNTPAPRPQLLFLSTKG